VSRSVFSFKKPKQSLLSQWAWHSLTTKHYTFLPSCAIGLTSFILKSTQWAWYCKGANRFPSKRILWFHEHLCRLIIHIAVRHVEHILFNWTLSSRKSWGWGGSSVVVVCLAGMHRALGSFHFQQHNTTHTHPPQRKSYEGGGGSG
jgi:hypothetical protein